MSAAARAADDTAGRRELLASTRAAAGQEVSGLPDFVLGSRPFGGIQSDETMLLAFERFAGRERERRRRLS